MKTPILLHSENLPKEISYIENMAFASRIDFYTNDTPRPDLVLEPSWWFQRQLRDRFPLVATVDDSLYMDYIYEVDLEGLKHVYINQLENLADRTNSTFLQLSAILESGLKYHKILVTVYEWETGIGD